MKISFIPFVKYAERISVILLINSIRKNVIYMFANCINYIAISFGVNDMIHFFCGLMVTWRQVFVETNFRICGRIGSSKYIKLAERISVILLINSIRKNVIYMFANCINYIAISFGVNDMIHFFCGLMVTWRQVFVETNFRICGRIGSSKYIKFNYDNVERNSETARLFVWFFIS